jgi:hypothetical protein
MVFGDGEARPVDGNDQTAMEEDRADGEAILLIEVRGVDSALEVGEAPEDRRQRPVRKSHSRRSDLQETRTNPVSCGSEAGSNLEHN